jgi:hypothetical protein
MKTIAFAGVSGRRVSRRVALGSLISALAAGQPKDPKSEVRIFAADPGTGVGALQVADAQGNVQQALGFVVACPQGCAWKQVADGKNPDRSVFLSPEWMKQIYFIGDASYAAEATDYYRKKVSDDAGVKGCGLVSANVEVRSVTRIGPNNYSDSTYGTGYFAIVPHGSPNAKGKIVPDSIWISKTKWDNKSLNSKKITDALAWIGKNLPKNPVCQWKP